MNSIQNGNKRNYCKLATSGDLFRVIVVQKNRLGFQEHDVEIPHEIVHKKSLRLIKEYLSSRNVAKATLMSTSPSK